MKIIYKLTLGFLLVSSLVGAVAYFGISASDSIHNAHYAVEEETIPVIKTLDDMKHAGMVVMMSTHEYSYISSENGTESALLEAEYERIASGKELYASSFKRYEGLVNKFFPEEKESLDNIRIAGQKLQNTSSEWIELKKQGASGLKVQEKHGELEQAGRDFFKAVDDALAREDTEFAERMDNLRSSIENTKKIISIVSLFTFIAAITSGIYLSTRFSKPILELKNAAVKLGKGELDTRVEIKSRDEVGILATCFNQMADRLEQDITERKRMEEALRRSEEHFRSLIENSFDIIMALDAEGTIRYLSPSVERLLGYKPEDMAGKNALDFVHPDDAPDVIKAITKAVETQGFAASVEFHVRHKDGTWRIQEGIGKSILDESGAVSIIVNIRDVTERRQAEEALRESEERYRRLVDYSPYGIAIHSEGKLVYVNVAGAQILGAANPSELIGKPVLQIIHPDYHEIVKERIRTEEEGKIAPLIEEKFLRLDGSPVDVEMVSIPFTYKGKLAMYGVFRDITGRKRAEEALRESEEKYRALMNDAADAILLADTEGNLVEVNKKAEALLGYTKKEFLNMHLTQIHPKEEIDRTIAAFKEIAKKGSVFLSDGVILKKDGKTVPVDITGSAIKYKDKILMQGIFRDISERKKAEELRFENERLVDANRVKSEFLSKMSHELRTPLNAIMGFSELLKTTEELNEKQRHYIDNIYESGEHLLSIVSAILDMVQVESGREIKLVINRFRVPEAIEESLNSIKNKAAQRNVVIKKELDPQLDFIEADEMRFRQVLFNLLDNAVKFSKPEGGIVTVAAKKEDNMARFSVSDTGIGIKEKDLGKLFQNFEQLESGTTRKYGGAGLGLAISKRLVELHGGKIRAESKFGIGSTFTLVLPLHAGKEGTK